MNFVNLIQAKSDAITGTERFLADIASDGNVMFNHYEAIMGQSALQETDATKII